MKGIPALKPVESSNIEAVGHAGSRLFIRFKGGSLYSYEGVSEKVYHEGLAAPSVGRWFRSKISGHHTHTRHDA